MPFLTKTDSNAVIKGSRDPLGVQALWTKFGRFIVGNLTTVSTSLRDFTATILGYTFIEQMEGEANEVELFLRWEQWAAYCRVHQFGQVPVRGIERVNERLRTGKPIPISACVSIRFSAIRRPMGCGGCTRCHHEPPNCSKKKTPASLMTRANSLTANTMALGLTQEELADQSQIDRRQLQRIEAGSANPGVEMLARLRKALDCSWPDLLAGM